MTNTYLPLTAARIKEAVSLSKDVWLSDSPGSRGCGQLLARVTRRGICRFYFRYSRNGKRKTIPLGRYARIRTEGFLTLREARQVARGLSASLLPPITFLGAPVDIGKSERRTTVAREHDLLAVTAVAPKRNDPTLLELCDLYCASLERQGKPSGKQQRYLIKHVERSEIGDRLAKDLRASDITPLLRGLVKANAGRTASKVRAMLHAAYAMALGSKYSATSDEAMGDHSIESNPISQIPALTEHNRARHRVLTRSEFREVWSRLQAGQGHREPMAVSALRLNIMLGGQRCTQLLRASVTDVNMDQGHILLMDPKGKRTEPRRHLLPLTAPAKKEIERLLAHSRDVHSRDLFVGDAQGRRLTPGTVSVVVKEICREMTKTDPDTPHFQYSDLRRTIETTLASLGVPPAHRAQLQSHGISGVQAKHYDMYEYMNEKLAALVVLERYLESLLVDPMNG